MALWLLVGLLLLAWTEVAKPLWSTISLNFSNLRDSRFTGIVSPTISIWPKLSWMRARTLILIVCSLHWTIASRVLTCVASLRLVNMISALFPGQFCPWCSSGLFLFLGIWTQSCQRSSQVWHYGPHGRRSPHRVCAHLQWSWCW